MEVKIEKIELGADKKHYKIMASGLDFSAWTGTPAFESLKDNVVKVGDVVSVSYTERFGKTKNGMTLYRNLSEIKPLQATQEKEKQEEKKAQASDLVKQAIAIAALLCEGCKASGKEVLEARLKVFEQLKLDERTKVIQNFKQENIKNFKQENGNGVKTIHK